MARRTPDIQNVPLMEFMIAVCILKKLQSPQTSKQPFPVHVFFNSLTDLLFCMTNDKRPSAALPSTEFHVT
jgi:hypothetical protein